MRKNLWRFYGCFWKNYPWSFAVIPELMITGTCALVAPGWARRHGPWAARRDPRMFGVRRGGRLFAETLTVKC